MPLTNLILNGTFASGSANWTGRDIEARHSESAYLSGGSSTNTVAELDGRAGPVTVMQQSFTVSAPKSTTLELDVALRDSSAPANGDGFRVEVLDSAGAVIASDVVLPTIHSFSTY